MWKNIFFAIAVAPLLHILYLNRLVPMREDLDYHGVPQIRLTEKGSLLDENARLVESGWSSHELKTLDCSRLPTWKRWLRLKKWDYYQVSTDEVFFAIAFADIGYASTIQVTRCLLTPFEVTFMDVEQQSFLHKERLLLSSPPFSDSIAIKGEQSYSYVSSDLQVQYTGRLLGDHNEQRYLNISLASDNCTLAVNLRLDSDTRWDRIIVHQPINTQMTQFFYNAKSFNWMAKGTVHYNDKTFQLMQSMSNAGLDWGRGVFNYHTFWLWASVQGFLKSGRRFALNLGGGF